MRHHTTSPVPRVAIAIVITIAIAIAIVCLSVSTAEGSNASTAADPAQMFRHDAWGRVLEEFVDQDGLVDYLGLAANRQTFDEYLERVQRIGPETHPNLFPGRQHELAYWINAYNAHVFDGVLDRGPETESVWSGGLISGRSFFVARDILVAGEKTNLKKLEDDVIRGRYRDPRIHAALNCASMSCPRLPREPFTADDLDQQLDRAMREFATSERNVKVLVERREVRLSKIFDWFEDDFLDFEKRQGNETPRLLDYVNRFRPSDRLIDRDLDIEFIPYDKSINARDSR